MSNVTITKLEDERIAVITLQKEPLNICERRFYQEIAMVFRDVNLMEDVSVVILKSGCRHFSAGGDLEEIQMCSSQQNIDLISGAAADCMEAIYGCRYPVIAAVHGKAIGAGVAMAACCDVCIAADDAVFSLPEIKAGYIGASEFLQMFIPRRLARYYIFTGEPMSAPQLKQWGSVLDVVPRPELADRVLTAARKIAAQSPLALMYFKEAMNHNDDERLREKYMFESTYTLKYNQSLDCKETMQAFREKRAPKYQGK